MNLKAFDFLSHLREIDFLTASEKVFLLEELLTSILKKKSPSSAADMLGQHPVFLLTHH